MGLLGALVVEDPSEPVVDIDLTMVLNDGPLGFTIDGRASRPRGRSSPAKASSSASAT